MMSVTIAALLVAGMGQAAAPSTELSDTRCVAAFALLVDQATADDDKQAATMGAIYFVGKLYGRNPDMDLTAGLRSVADDVGNHLKDELARCGAEMATAGEAMSAAGKALGETK